MISLLTAFNNKKGLGVEFIKSPNYTLQTPSSLFRAALGSERNRSLRANSYKANWLIRIFTGTAYITIKYANNTASLYIVNVNSRIPNIIHLKIKYGDTFVWWMAMRGAP